MPSSGDPLGALPEDIAGGMDGAPGDDSDQATRGTTDSA